MAEAEDTTLAAQLAATMRQMRSREAEDGGVVARTPASLEAARELEARQEETLRLLQSEVADLEQQRDRLKRENSEMGLARESPTKRGRAGRAAKDALPDADIQQIIDFLLKDSQRSFVTSLQAADATASSAAADPAERDPLQPSVSERELPADLPAQVQSMATIAGLEFLSATATMQQTTGGDWVRAYDLTGHSYGLHFRASFRASDATHQILDLALAVSPEARSELAQFIATSERERALLVFFKGLVRYARLRAHRLRLFERLQTQFPSLVTFPHSAAFSTSAVFERSPHDEAHGPSVQLVLMYELRLTADGRVEPNVALLPRVAKPGPGNPLGVATTQTGASIRLMFSLPARFLSLVSVVGVGHATEMLVKTVLASS